MVSCDVILVVFVYFRGKNHYIIQMYKYIVIISKIYFRRYDSCVSV